MKRVIVLLLGACLAFAAQAQKTDIKVKGIDDSNGDTSILVHKGAIQDQCTEYHIVDGTDSVMGDPDFDTNKAYASWKTACAEWKRSMRDLNQKNSLIMMNCGSPTMSRNETQYVYQSNASYKVRVKVRETTLPR